MVLCRLCGSCCDPGDLLKCLLKLVKFIQSFRITKNGIIVELHLALWVWLLYYQSSTNFSELLFEKRALERGFCNVTEVIWRDAECNDKVTQLPTVSGYFVFLPKFKRCGRSKGNCKDQRLNNALAKNRSEIKQVAEWTLPNLTQWESQPYTNMSQNRTSFYGLFPYNEFKEKCNSSTTYDTISSQLTELFPWLQNYTRSNTTLETSYRECDLFQPTNTTLYHRTSLTSLYGQGWAWGIILFFTLLAVGPITRRGDEPFKSLLTPIWYLSYVVFMPPHLVFNWIRFIGQGCQPPTFDFLEGFSEGSLCLPLVQLYFWFEENCLKVPSPEEPESDEPKPEQLEPEQSKPEGSTSEPPVYNDIDDESVVITNIPSSGYPLEVPGFDPPSYEKVVCETTNV